MYNKKINEKNNKTEEHGLIDEGSSALYCGRKATVKKTHGKGELLAWSRKEKG